MHEHETIKNNFFIFKANMVSDYNYNYYVQVYIIYMIIYIYILIYILSYICIMYTTINYTYILELPVKQAHQQ